MLGIARTVGRSSAPQYTASYLLLLRLSISSFPHMKKKNNRISINVGFKIKGQVELLMSVYHKFSQFLLKCRVRHYPRELILLNIKNDTFSQTGCIYQKASKNNVCRDNFPTIVKFPASIRLATSRPQAECQYRENRYACGE